MTRTIGREELDWGDASVCGLGDRKAPSSSPCCSAGSSPALILGVVDDEVDAPIVKPGVRPLEALGARLALSQDLGRLGEGGIGQLRHRIVGNMGIPRKITFERARNDFW